ncbi:2-C-methyl-D-erythritol 4-phosphate cytidylyltransferase [Labedaea rhizosphaerae]|uniref:2-C-methyl-D-erythritol 4-phosphate cytidylyltransferase n=1 Tax=Labedaea rhizosphaerae TaxID=598644 RepID=A0A4R6SKQ7_LABRH|nr:2-C-methyl-D-erythritol 4-phosphate cytidylyltransferase [Labedaea rhizosphaerae]TDQ04659.1 2-C-methyl-D-erythritol 4-phosphate cytidylyltransferase [Labedaea rhizosphaerae]
MSVVALVPAAGRGERLGADLPKALVPVAGAPLLVHAVRGLLDSGCVDHVVVAAPPLHVEQTESLLSGLSPVTVVAGGADRTSSVRITLDHVVASDTVVLVHDAARAFTPASVIKRVVAAVQSGKPAVIPVLAVTDTIKQVDASGVVTATIDRSSLRAVQTPQGFALDVLRRAHASAGDTATDDATLVERLGIPVHTVEGHPHALKITTPFDLAIAESHLPTP